MSMDTTAKTIKFNHQPMLSDRYSINKIYDDWPIIAIEATCPYCSEGKPLISQDDIWINVFSDQLISFAYDENGKISLLNASINYCPICGRKVSKKST